MNMRLVIYISGTLTCTFYSVSRDSSSARLEIIDLKQLLKDAEDRRLTDLEHSEKAAEARRVADLQAAEARRAADLQAAEERRIRDLERAETAAEARRLTDLERAEKRVHGLEELLRSIIGIILHRSSLPLPLTSISSVKMPEIPSPRQ